MISASPSIWKNLYRSLLVCLEKYMSGANVDVNDSIELHPFQQKENDNIKSGVCLASVPLFNKKLSSIDRNCCSFEYNHFRDTQVSSLFIRKLSKLCKRLSISYCLCKYDWFVVCVLLLNIGFMFHIPIEQHPFNPFVKNWEQNVLLDSWK